VTAATVAPTRPLVTIGVDTHSDVHVAVALDQLGRRLSTVSIDTTPDGYVSLEHWAQQLGDVVSFGVEGTGSWGAGLVRHLRQNGHHILEVNRPDRGARRRHGKSDPLDAEAAARAVLACTATSTPKAGEGHVEMIRSLQLTRRSAQKARSQAANQLRALLVTAPADLRQQLRALTLTELVKTAAAWRPGREPGNHTTVVKHSLRSLARRHQQLTEEIRDLDKHLARLVTETAPDLIAVKGLGPLTCAALLVAVGDNPQRLRSESAFAHLCGAAPVPASSGKTNRHRLNRGGDRQANYALYILAVTRMAWDPRTRAYVEKRRAQGKTTKEIIRCLKRHIARELYRLLVPLRTEPTGPGDALPTAA
jgi:transposase